MPPVVDHGEPTIYKGEWPYLTQKPSTIYNSSSGRGGTLERPFPPMLESWLAWSCAVSTAVVSLQEQEPYHVQKKAFRSSPPILWVLHSFCPSSVMLKQARIRNSLVIVNSTCLRLSSYPLLVIMLLTARDSYLHIPCTHPTLSKAPNNLLASGHPLHWAAHALSSKQWSKFLIL